MQVKEHFVVDLERELRKKQFAFQKSLMFLRGMKRRMRSIVDVLPFFVRIFLTSCSTEKSCSIISAGGEVWTIYPLADAVTVLLAA